MRPDLFPADICDGLATLRDTAPVHDFHHTRELVKDAFGKDIEELFEHFDESPAASGSIAQVHHGILKSEYALPGGVVDVAVKVRHPNVVDETYIDMKALLASLGVVRWLSGCADCGSCYLKCLRIESLTNAPLTVVN